MRLGKEWTLAGVKSTPRHPGTPGVPRFSGFYLIFSFSLLLSFRASLSPLHFVSRPMPHSAAGAAWTNSSGRSGSETRRRRLQPPVQLRALELVVPVVDRASDRGSLRPVVFVQAADVLCKAIAVEAPQLPFFQTKTLAGTEYLVRTPRTDQGEPMSLRPAGSSGKKARGSKLGYPGYCTVHARKRRLLPAR